MKDKINKTNAARLLDKAKVPYELIPYEVDENDLSAPHVAASLGEDINCVFKTLVLHGDEVRPDTRQGTAAPHWLHPWRLFAHRHEETVSYLYPPHVSRLPLYICQCRDAWLAAENSPARPNSGGKGRSLRLVCWIIGQNGYICTIIKNKLILLTFKT